MNEELESLYSDINELEEGRTVYNVIPDVDPENINSWKKQLIEAGFYVNIDFLGSAVNIYYASPDYIEYNYGEYSMGGWSN